jgi:hypothetical protein
MTHLRIVRGDATPEEVAALVAALAAALAAARRPVAPAKPKQASWNDPASRMRRQLPRTWRASAMPH